MSAVTTLAVTVAAAAGAVALCRYAEKRTRPLRAAIDEMRKSARAKGDGAVLDYEQDPESGVFKPKSAAR
ncbi:hypothetical protein [Hyphococcus luteus]|uniref:Uncharacterized protein n=1 Tax=Hyphococcus luteus TaxID=2058213 RepID=A0A2S7K5M4_9PROT|nr:hypothetical protein [Marinicaulis flavus]PQA87814.1 hypothetical protein CW354_05530 [Marinicaulis flavus]